MLARTATGIRLKHDHRQEDGSADAIAMYGGDTAADVWALEIEPGQRFVYELARPGTGRLFRVEFDLTTAIAEPPPRW